jgi:hypothetical protein
MRFVPKRRSSKDVTSGELLVTDEDSALEFAKEGRRGLRDPEGSSK